MTRPSFVLDESLIEERFVRSPGPGGQNVNKVASAVQLRFALAKSALPAAVRQRAARLAGERLTKDGFILIVATKFRSQASNRADARQRLVALLERAAIAPRVRVRTAPTAGARERRLEDKRRTAAVKKNRTMRPDADRS